MEIDQTVRAKVGWVREMGGYIAAASQITPAPAKFLYHQDFMYQPQAHARAPGMMQPKYCGLEPRTRCPRNTPYIFHYTYGLPFDKNGNACDVAINGGKACVHWFTKRHFLNKYPTKLETAATLPVGIKSDVVTFYDLVNKRMTESEVYQGALARGFGERATADMRPDIANEYEFGVGMTTRQRQLIDKLNKAILRGKLSSTLII